MPNFSIGFEGMHRSGKGTQIDKVTDFFEQKKIKVHIIRGAGSRLPKYGLDYNYDFWSSFRENRNSIDSWIEAASIISTENTEFMDSLKGYYELEVVLFDRTYISNNFFLTQNDLPIKHPFYIPDVTYYLNARKSTLLERCSEDESDKREFRTNNVINNYDEYTHYIGRQMAIPINEAPSADQYNIIIEDICLRIFRKTGLVL